MWVVRSDEDGDDRTKMGTNPDRGEVSWPMDGGRGALRAVEELLVELGVAHVVVQGDHAYWQGISGDSGVGAHMRGRTDCVQEGAGCHELTIFTT